MRSRKSKPNFSECLPLSQERDAPYSYVVPASASLPLCGPSELTRVADFTSGKVVVCRPEVTFEANPSVAGLKPSVSGMRFDS